MSNFIIPISNLPSVSSIKAENTVQNIEGLSGDSAFGNLLQNAIENSVNTTATNQEGLLNLALGGSDDLHNTSIAVMKAQLANNFTANLTSAAIRSYNELMRMQI